QPRYRRSSGGWWAPVPPPRLRRLERTRMPFALEGVTKTVGPEVYVRDVNLHFADGSLNVLLGPTLSGKTSLMRLMAGLDLPSSGRVIFDGNDVTGVPVGRRNVAMVYQQFINYPTLSVYENIA